VSPALTREQLEHDNKRLREDIRRVHQEKRDLSAIANSLHNRATMELILEAGGIDIRDCLKVPNRYWPVPYQDMREQNPWYAFTVLALTTDEKREDQTQVRTATVLVGARKRVFSIQVTSDLAFNVHRLRGLWVTDRNTYVVDSVTGSEVGTGKDVVIHAWGVDQAKRYLREVVDSLNEGKPYQAVPVEQPKRKKK